MTRKILPLGAIAANCIILWDETAAADTTPCWIVDPGGEPETLLAFLEKNRLAPALVALTHGHFDHIGALDGLLAACPTLPVHIGPGDVPMIGHPMNLWPPEYPGVKKPATLVADLTDGTRLAAGGLEAEILATPGHTPGGVSIHFPAERLVLTGDTLFAGSCGRTDFPGGDMPTLRNSLARLAALPPETDVVCGHGSPTTIGREVASNPYLN